MDLKPSVHAGRRLPLRNLDPRFVILAGTIAALLQTAASGQLYWDANGLTAGSGTPGAFTWDAGTNWTPDVAGGSATTAWVDGSPVFFSAGTESAGTWDITIANTIKTNAITFRGTANTIHNISGGAIDIGTSGLVIDATAQSTGTGRSKNISSAISGSGGLTLAVNGDLSATGGSSNSNITLSGANTFLGNVTITSGVVNATSNFGDFTNKIILNGGGLVDPNINVELLRDIEIGAAGGVIRLYGNTTNFRMAGALNGSGTLRRTDGGTALIIGNGTGFTGTFAVERGALQIGDGFTASNLVPNAAGITVGTSTGAGTFRYNLDTSITLTTPVTYANAGSTLAWQGTNADDVLTINNAFGTNTTTGNLRVHSGAITFASGADIKVGALQITSTPANSTGAVVGVMNIQSGASLQTGYFNIGDGSNTAGVVNQSGGTVTIVPGGTGFRLGHWSNGSTPGSVYNLSGGTLDASATGLVINVGWDGAGTMNVSGTGVLKAQRLYVDAAGVDQPGIVNLQTGGTIEVGAGGTVNDGTTGSMLNLAGGTLRGVASSTWASKMDANASTSSFVDITAGAVVTASGVLSGTGELVKTGAGALSLTGVNTFAGSTRVEAGAFVVTNTYAPIGTITVNGGTIATAGNGSTTGLLGSLVVNAGGTIQPGILPTDGSFGTMYATSLVSLGNARFDLTGGDFTIGATNDRVVVSGAATLNGGTITPVFAGAPSAGTYTLLSAATSLTAPVLPTVAGTDSSRLTFATGVSGKDLQLTITGNAKSLTWSGSGVWNLATSTNWTDGSQSEKFFRFDNVTFDDTSLASSNVSLEGSLTPGAVVVSGGKDYTFTGTGSISGGTSLTKTGFSTLTLLTNNNYTGATSILEGRVVVGNGGTTGTLGGTGAIALTTAALEYNRSDNFTLSRAFTGTDGTLQKDGTGEMTLGPSFVLLPRNLVVNAGKLIVQGGSFTGNRMEGTGLVTINAGGTLVVSAATAHAFGGSNASMTESFMIIGGTLSLGSEQYFNSLFLDGATINGIGEIRASNSTSWFVAGTKPSTIANPIAPYNAVNLSVDDVTANASSDLILGGSITAQAGTINQMGLGTVEYTGTTTGYTGTYSVSSGTLLVRGSVTGTSTFNIGFGGALAGNGTLPTVSVAGGLLNPGSGVGTLTTGNLTIDSFSTVRFELAAAGTVGGLNDLITTNGSLSLDGTLEVVPLAGFSAGVYRLFNYTGTFTDGGLDLSPTFLGIYPNSYIDVATPGQVSLYVVPEPGSVTTVLLGIGGLLAMQRIRRRSWA